ncbi:MAG: hypothetical protein OHK0028_03510 [Deltaproteobacteria bacterium]
MNVLSRIPGVALLLLFAGPLQGGEFPPAIHVDLPAPETASRLERCFSSSGFDVTRRDLPGTEIRIGATRGTEVWNLRVSPRSPLGAVVDWERVAGDPHPGGSSEDLRACVALRSAPDVVSAEGKFVVCLRAMRKGREIRFSGLLVGEEGTVVTTAHDLDRVEVVSVRLPGGGIVPGTIARSDPSRDLSRIDLPAPVPGFSLEGRVRDRLTPDEPVWSIGCPDGGAVRLKEGRVEGEPRTSGGMPLWEVRMETIPGSSGGPAFDAAGNLAGLVKGRYRGTKNRGYLVPVRTVLEFLETAKRGDRRR